MSFKDIDREIKHYYKSPDDNILEDFYIKVLSESTSYKRMTGPFSSTILAGAAKGISRFIKNNGNMELICWATLSKKDVKAIEEGKKEPETLIEEVSLNRLELEEIEDKLLKDHLKALSWMVANDYLDIRIAVKKGSNGKYVTNDIDNLGEFHPKSGILKDEDGNEICFSGSANESLYGWKYNIEELNVFKEWIDGSRDYFKAHKKTLDDYWNNDARKIKVYNFTEAIANKLLEIVPNSQKEVLDLDLEKRLLSKMKKNYNKYIDSDDNNKNIKEKSKIELRGYQKKAKKEWFNNNYIGILEMATGTGKTYTALLSVRELLKKLNTKHLLIICVPYQHLVEQWESDIKDIFSECKMVKCFKSKNKWHPSLNKLIQNLIFDKIDLGVAITTTSTGSKDLFINTVNTNKVNKMVVCDEVHNIGATKSQNFLNIESDIRLGLSATPIRQYDEEGNKAIKNYFGGSVYKLKIKEAIDRGYLVPYNYYIYFCELNAQEYKEYNRYSKKIPRLYNEEGQLIDENKLQRILIKRAKIKSTCEEKLQKFSKILDNITEKNKLLVFTAEDPMFFEDTLNILNKKNWLTLKITSRVKQEDRPGIIKKLENKDIDSILAMRCLDEGVDIPAADKAIILSSSTNSKQYIQRRGRVLRKHEESNKNYANIYDFLVIPKGFSNQTDKSLFERELERILEFASSARNGMQVISKIRKFSHKNSLMKNFINILGEFSL